MKVDSKQNGLAIITVMLIVALMVTLLGFLVEQQHLLIRRITNQNVAEQGYQYAVGVSDWAARVLHDDKDRAIDYSGEDWAMFGSPVELEDETDSFSLDLSSQEDEDELPVVEFGEGAELHYKIIDLQSRYNLNNLADRDKAYVESQKQIFLNLLELVGVDEADIRENLYGALVDWLDENDLNGPNGIESGEYQTQSTPYYAADQRLSALGELRFIRGFSEEIIRQLKPYVTALPAYKLKININTVSEEVLASLGSVPVVNLSSVTDFLAIRELDGFLGFQSGNIAEAGNAIIGVSPVRVAARNDMMQTNSQFFQVNTQVILGDYQFCMQTILLRDNAVPNSSSTPKVTVLSRQHDTLCDEDIY